MTTIELISYPDRTMLSDGANYIYFVFADAAHPMYDENFQPILMPDGNPELYPMYVSVPIPNGIVPDEDTLEELRTEALVYAKQQAKERADGIARTILLSPFIADFMAGSPETVFEGDV